MSLTVQGVARTQLTEDHSGITSA